MESSITDKPQEPAPGVAARVEYTIEPEDYVEGYLFVWEKSLRRQMHKGIFALLGRAVLFILFVALATGLCLNRVRHPLVWIVMIGALAVSYPCLVAQVYMVIIPLRKHIRRGHFRKQVEAQFRAGTFRAHRRDCLSMTWMGFTEVNDWREADGGVRIVERKEFEVQWSAVESIDVTDRLAIFTVTRKGLLFLPKWAFENEEAFVRFVETARNLLRAFLSGRAAVAPPPAASGSADGLRLPQ